MDPNLANSLAGPGLGAGLGAIIGHQSGNAAEGALIGAVAGFIIQEVYRASERQKNEAQSRANAYRQSASSQRKFKQSGASVVAIPVRKDASSSSKNEAGVMLFDPRSGNLVSDKVYTSKDRNTVSNGEVVKIGSRKAMVYGSGAI